MERHIAFCDLCGSAHGPHFHFRPGEAERFDLSNQDLRYGEFSMHHKLGFAEWVKKVDNKLRDNNEDEKYGARAHIMTAKSVRRREPGDPDTNEFNWGFNSPNAKARVWAQKRAGQPSRKSGPSAPSLHKPGYAGRSQSQGPVGDGVGSGPVRGGHRGQASHGSGERRRQGRREGGRRQGSGESSRRPTRPSVTMDLNGTPPSGANPPAPVHVAAAPAPAPPPAPQGTVDLDRIADMITGDLTEEEQDKLAAKVAARRK